jgi:hypothetical protein
VEEIAAAARLLITSLATEAEPKNREQEMERAKARSAKRFAVQGSSTS